MRWWQPFDKIRIDISIQRRFGYNGTAEVEYDQEELLYVNPITSRHSNILVVGGGVIGLACAYYLARSGRSVRLIERETNRH